MTHFTIVCGFNQYNFNGMFYFWALEVVQDYILAVRRNHEDDTIILVVGDEAAADIQFLRERCGYGLTA